MLQYIRNLSFGWPGILLGIVAILSGMSMENSEGGSRTLLCFDDGCIHVQAWSNIALGVLVITLSIYLLLRDYKFLKYTL